MAGSSTPLWRSCGRSSPATRGKKNWWRRRRGCDSTSPAAAAPRWGQRATRASRVRQVAACTRRVRRRTGSPSSSAPFRAPSTRPSLTRDTGCSGARRGSSRSPRRTVRSRRQARRLSGRSSQWRSTRTWTRRRRGGRRRAKRRRCCSRRTSSPSPVCSPTRRARSSPSRTASRASGRPRWRAARDVRLSFVARGPADRDRDRGLLGSLSDAAWLCTKAKTELGTCLSSNNRAGPHLDLLTQQHVHTHTHTHHESEHSHAGAASAGVRDR
mmetsp:Transcript_37770/g.118925  ORF Transcript_37770/g.118925 Transcript_37770/m.118925 type:complete len:270 (+) Transcript_37770:1964-2773(+)